MLASGGMRTGCRLRLTLRLAARGNGLLDFDFDVFSLESDGVAGDVLRGWGGQDGSAGDVALDIGSRARAAS